MKDIIERVVLVVAITAAFYGATVLVMHYLHRDSGAARLSEATSIEAKGGVVELPEDQAALIAEVAELKAANADFASALEVAQTAAPDAKPVTIFRASTGPLQCKAVPPLAVPVMDPSSPKTCPSCIIAADEQPEIRVEALELRTPSGNTVLAGAAGVYVGDDRRFGGPFSAPLVTAHEVEQAQSSPPWWRYAVAGVGGVVAGILLTSLVRR